MILFSLYINTVMAVARLSMGLLTKKGDIFYGNARFTVPSPYSILHYMNTSLRHQS